MPKRYKTEYPGVFYREVDRTGGKGIEKVFYVVYKKAGKMIEAKAGKQYQDDMTAARAARYRANLIEGKAQLPKEKRAAKRAARIAEKNKWTFSKLWESYKENKPGLKGLKTDQNRFDNHIKDLFGDREPADLVPLDIDRLRLKISKKHAPATVRNVLELLRRIINYGVRKQLCAGPQFNIEMPAVNNVKTEDLTPDQLKALLTAIDADDHAQAGAMMKLALYAGLRRGEMFALKWSDIDFRRGFIHIRDPKGGVDQKVPLNEASRALLSKQPRLKKSPYVFPGKAGRQRTDINKAVRTICNAAGLPKNFRPLHGLRHVYASMLASSGQVDMYVLQKLLTHKSPTMTARYAHLRDDALKQAADLAGALVGAVSVDKEEKAG